MLKGREVANKILIIAGFDKSLLLFRKQLIESWLKSGLKVVAAAPGERVKEDIEGVGASYRSLPLSRTGINPLEDIMLTVRILKLLKEERPKLLFLYTAKPVIYGSIAAYAFSKCRVFSLITGLGYSFSEFDDNRVWLKRFVSLLYKIALKKNEKVFFQNYDDSSYFLENALVSKAKVVNVNGSGVDLDHYRPLPVTTDQVRFLLISRLIISKGIFEFIEAARILKNKYPNTCFVMIGWALANGPLSIKKETVESWEKEGIVKIHGETDDVRPFIADASVFVLPTYYREGVPRTILEAMAMGRAIITTDTPGCRDTVIEGVNGFLVPPKDSEALAVTMEKFILEPNLVKIMGKESRRIAEQKYNVHKINCVMNEAMGIMRDLEAGRL